MRTDDTNPTNDALGKVRAQVETGRRWLQARGAATRWTLAGLALAALIAAGYHASTTAPVEWAYLYQNSLSRERLDAVATALNSSAIPFRENAKGLVSVPANRKYDALAAIDKAKANPPSIKEIQQAAHTLSPFDSTTERMERQDWALVRAIEVMIETFPGVASADVMISRGPRTRSTSQDATALVFLQKDDDAPIRHRTIERIRQVLRTRVRDLRPDGVTIVDAEHTYLSVDHPELGVQSEARAREEDLSEEILDQLSRIDGVRVSVKLEAAPSIALNEPAGSPIEPEPEPEPVIVINRPLGKPAPPAPPPPPPLAVEPGPVNRVKVLVEVPRSYYRNLIRDLNPSRDDLKALAARTEEWVGKVVQHVVPEGELSEPIEIQTINDPIPARPPRAPDGATLWQPEPWWLAAAGAALAIAAALAAAGGRWLATRRPAARPSRPIHRPHYDQSDAPGPSERVRDLVRRDPEAAAGVLNRWIASGGGPDA
jgi:type III secretory pathway lipoprotein EscJ